MAPSDIQFISRDQLEAAIKGEAGVRSIIYAYETGAVIEQANKW